LRTAAEEIRNRKNLSAFSLTETRRHISKEVIHIRNKPTEIQQQKLYSFLFIPFPDGIVSPGRCCCNPLLYLVGCRTQQKPFVCLVPCHAGTLKLVQRRLPKDLCAQGYTSLGEFFRPN